MNSQSNDNKMIFDTGRPNSAWGFGIGVTFGVGSLTGAFFVVRDRWIYRTVDLVIGSEIGTLVLCLLSAFLIYVFLQSFQRTVIRVSKEYLCWRTAGPLGLRSGKLSRSDVRRILINGSDIMFSVRLELMSGEKVTVLYSAGTRLFKRCLTVLRSFMPEDKIFVSETLSGG